MYNQSPYEIYNGKIGVRVSYIASNTIRFNDRSLGLTSYEAIRKKYLRNPELKLKEGRGEGNEALINWVTLPHDWRQKCKEAFGDPELDAVPTLLEKHYHRDPKAADFYANWKRPDDRNLDYNLIQEYTTNASMLNAVIATMANRKALRKALGGSTSGVWETVFKEVEIMRAKTQHSLKVPSLKRTIAAYKKDGYLALISGKLGNKNTAKLKDETQLAMLEELLKHHNNLDNEQITDLYNMAAKKIGWPTISSSTVANKRKELGLYIESGRRGESHFRNTKSMQVKRRAPAFPLYYWTLDGWDAELLYQKTGLNAKGHSVTTYHHRMTAVVVLDPCCKYPVGYAIGTHETADLIREALRDAVNHTKHLFGNWYKPLQLQSDHYGKGSLVPIYEAMTKHYTPARVKNAKAKVIEPYFLALNKSMQFLPNWSGYGVTVNPDKQPNPDYLNKIRHSFPDEEGCRMQIIHALEMKRAEALDAYMAKWDAMPEADKKPLEKEEYLNLFGHTTGYTNRLHHYGLKATINGEEYVYDSFDVRFREMSAKDWCVKYDPDDLSEVLVVDAKSLNGKLKEELNTVRFMLRQKHEQPMSLRERSEGDAGELMAVQEFNRQLEGRIVERGRHNYEMINEVLQRPELEGTASKLLLVDSMGQHKDNKSRERMKEKAQQMVAKQERQRLALQERQEDREERMRKEEYLDNKVNLDDYL